MTEQSVQTAIRYESADGRATITIDNPAKRNPLSSHAAHALVEALRRGDNDPNVRVIVITGAGSTFSAGADLQEFQQMLTASAVDVWDNGDAWAELYSMIPTLGKPVVARIEGPAMAGACGLVCCCDLAVASPDATFAIPEIRIGLFALFILPALIERIGRAHARDLAYTGRVIIADEALRMGLVNRVSAKGALDAAVDEVVEELSKARPGTMRRARQAFRAIADADYDTGIELARGLRAPFLASDELKAGVAHFFKPKG